MIDQYKIIPPLKIYTEKGHADTKDWLKYLIHPIRAWWGDGTSEWKTWALGFEFYKSLFVLTDEIVDSDAVFLPMTVNYYIDKNQLGLVNDLISKSEAVGKTTYAWIDGDHQILYDHPKCIFLKYSGYKSQLKHNDFILSGDVKKDLLIQHYNGKLIRRSKNQIPLIGFDGIATYPILRLGGLIFKNSLAVLAHYFLSTGYVPNPVFPPFLKRKQIIHLLEQIDGIHTNFNIRDSFAIGTRGGNKAARNEYINNIIGSDYTLWYRGAANYSLRLYESLCLGRIPLFVNTDCKLPFEEQINWLDICIWVDDDELSRIGDIIIDFHQSMTNNQFIEKQVYCRELWIKYFSKEGFYNQFYNYLNTNLKN